MAAALPDFGDVEDLLKTWLAEELDVPVVTAVPNPRPDAFVVVEVVGGTRVDIVADAPTVSVDAWAQSRSAAADLAQAARRHLYAVVGETVDGHTFGAVTELSRPQNFPDPTSGQHRYTATYSLVVRGVRSGS